jgi:DNA mismatch repair protein MutH
MAAPPPPDDLEELARRAAALEGVRTSALAAALGHEAPVMGVRSKGKVGELVERALGATGGAAARHDFPHLGVELKTIPVDPELRPRESTYVCRIDLATADREEWATSWFRRKLAHVLWVPIVDNELVARPFFWSPTAAQERALRLDFEELMGVIGAGHVEDLTARAGVWLQVRPKARDGSERTTGFDRDGDPVRTVPRGFYLRPRFTAALLRDPAFVSEDP